MSSSQKYRKPKNNNMAKTRKNIHRHSNKSHSKKHTSRHDNTIVIGKIYANWCGHCTALKPEWEKMKAIIKKDLGKYLTNINIEFSEIEQTNEHINVDNINRQYLINSNEKLSASGYPTIFKIHNNNLDYYKGSRTAQEMADWYIKHSPPVSKIINSHVGGRKRKSRKNKRRSNRMKW